MKFKIALATLLFPAVLFSQSSSDKAAQDVKQQREQLMAMGVVPGEVSIEEGKDAFHKNGPNGKSCAECHGKDGAKIKDAFRSMPKFYADGKKVMDIDLRIKTCMEKNQGHEKADRKKGDFINLVVYVASLSNGKTITTSVGSDANMKEMYDLGENLWFKRVGEMDLSCAVCHDQLGGKRIRLQNLAKVKQDKVSNHWPAYRFSNDSMWTMEDRIRGCYKQIRVPEPKH